MTRQMIDAEKLRHAADKSTHRLSQELLRALADEGWTQVPEARGLLFQHPRSMEELPTPEYMRGSKAWPFETYHRLRQLSIALGGPKGDRVVFRMSRTGPPWVRVSERVLTYRAAIEFVRAPYDPDAG